MDIFVKNLPLSITSSQLEQLFSMHGRVLSANVIFDRETKQSRGFAFVKMPDEAEAKLAIGKINGSEIDGKIISAQKALPKRDNSGFKSPSDTVLPRSFKPPKNLVKRSPFKDYH